MEASGTTAPMTEASGTTAPMPDASRTAAPTEEASWKGNEDRYQEQQAGTILENRPRRKMEMNSKMLACVFAPPGCVGVGGDDEASGLWDSRWMTTISRRDDLLRSSCM